MVVDCLTLRLYLTVLDLSLPDTRLYTGLLLVRLPIKYVNRGLFLESPKKPLVELRPVYSAKLVFLYVVKGIQNKITVLL